MGHRPERNRNMSEKRKIVLADNSEEFRRMLAEMLQGEPEIGRASCRERVYVLV